MRSRNQQAESNHPVDATVLEPCAVLPHALPVWLAALMATCCHAVANGEKRAVAWRHAHGRAFYTNAGADSELIHPFGIELERGHTVAVYWTTGATEYTIEVHPHCSWAWNSVNAPRSGSGAVLQ